ncbi:MAG TPA: tetratricopeptide repeat protein [Aliidongia sp.]|uniref:tetratricopeptide repeat protein n=1 Tax=Aliidongia sp. TaxID=1914230 RepID=UPI002DDD0780|nr:tetratricopeptide repeat protein [Aliidongia sp.]HEV2677501.1 tetratricopeptide repeat protein [Aliidongia sp.]
MSPASDGSPTDPAPAIGRARRAVAQSPDAPEPLFRLCALLLRQGDASANALLPRLEAFRHYAAGWLHLGEALFAARQIEGAAVAFARAQAAEPGNAAGHFGQGRCLRERGRLQEAATAFEQAATLQPRFAQAWFALGLVRDDLRDAGAADAYGRALDADPTLHEAALNLGIARQETGDLDGALDAYGRALRTRPEALGRIAHALSSSPTGCLFLDPADLHRALLDRA